MSTLEIKDLHAAVENPDGTQKEILKGVNLTVKSGETHAVMGPNGSGKSTLLRIIAGIARQNEGTARWHPLLAGGRLGYVPQAGGLYADLSRTQFGRESEPG